MEEQRMGLTLKGALYVAICEAFPECMENGDLAREKMNQIYERLKELVNIEEA